MTKNDLYLSYEKFINELASDNPVDWGMMVYNVALQEALHAISKNGLPHFQNQLDSIKKLQIEESTHGLQQELL